MHIFFAAHGTTTDNENKIASGWKDVELSELGKEQAIELGKVFESMPLDLVCCSDLQRALNTAKLAFGDKLPIMVDKRLRELNYGDFNGQPSAIVESMKTNKIHASFANGESYEQAVTRNQEFYKELRQKYFDKTVLIIGHRATQYGLETLINRKTLEELLSVKFKWQPYWEYQY